MSPLLRVPRVMGVAFGMVAILVEVRRAAVSRPWTRTAGAVIYAALSCAASVNAPVSTGPSALSRSAVRRMTVR